MEGVLYAGKLGNIPTRGSEEFYNTNAQIVATTIVQLRGQEDTTNRNLDLSCLGAPLVVH